MPAVLVVPAVVVVVMAAVVVAVAVAVVSAASSTIGFLAMPFVFCLVSTHNCTASPTSPWCEFSGGEPTLLNDTSYPVVLEEKA